MRDSIVSKCAHVKSKKCVKCGRCGKYSGKYSGGGWQFSSSGVLLSLLVIVHVMWFIYLLSPKGGV